MERKGTVDDAIITLSHLYIMGAQYLLDVMTKAVQHYCLDEAMSPEQKRRLKSDCGFTSKAVLSLGEASRAYKTMIRNLDIVESELNKRLHDKRDYSKQVANMQDLISVDLVYMMLSEGNAENEQKIHEFLKSFEWPDDLDEVYQITRARRAKMTSSL